MKMLGFLALILSLQASASEGTMNYKVPTPDALAPYSEYPSKFDFSSGNDGVSRLHYILPATLTGFEVEMKFEGRIDYSNPQAPFKLSGPNGEAICSPLPNNSSQAKCDVVQYNIAIDLMAVMEALSGNPSFSEEQKLGHLAVSAFLLDKGGDLVGSFTYPLNQF